MGQAKQRGSFEQRQALAIERATAETTAERERQEERRKREREAEMELPPEVRERRRQARFQTQQKIAMLAGLVAMGVSATKGHGHGN